MLKILVAIANYGTKNKKYVDMLINEYISMDYNIDIVILSNIPKDFGPNIEVRVGLPTSDPWSLPFAHKQLFAEHQDNYDLFIYSEDDTLIEQRHIIAFLEATQVLPEDKIVGFLRYEEDSFGKRYCSTIHSHYHWQVDSIQQSGKYIYAYFTNEHSASFILTRKQLKFALDSGGFLVGPHKGRYDLLCTAATDPYTQCGLTKVLCISHIDDFLLHHLPNNYLGKMGLSYEEMHAQINKMISSYKKKVILYSLIPKENQKNPYLLKKMYYPILQDYKLNIIPSTVHSILSIGCEQGIIEEQIIKKGKVITAIPIDDIIAVSAESRGVKILTANFDIAFKQIEKQKYDLIYINDIINFLDNPRELLRKCAHYIYDKGFIIIDFINYDSIKNRLYFLNKKREYTAQQINLIKANNVNMNALKCMLDDLDFKIINKIYILRNKSLIFSKLTLNMFNKYLAYSGVILAAKK